MKIKPKKLCNGGIQINGYKHAMVQIIAASIALNVPVLITNAPLTDDIYILKQIIENCGGFLSIKGQQVSVNTQSMSIIDINANLSKQIHGSIYLMPAFAVRFGKFSFLIFVKIISVTATNALAIRAYIIAITGFFEIIAWSIARGNQIIIGQVLGSKKITVANFALIEGVMWSCFFSLILIGTILPFRYVIMRFFSNDVDIINMGARLLLLVAILTLLRAINFNFSSALKSAGDVKFCVILIAICMWGGNRAELLSISQLF